MFAKHPDRMPPEATPERLYAFCTWVLTHPAPRQELEKQFVMQDVFGQQASIFSLTMKAAEELGLLVVNDGVVRVSAPAVAFEGYTPFRRYMARIVFDNPDTTFYKFSEWYLTQNEAIYSNVNWDSVAAKADADNVKVVGQDLLGWRWWASFLGLGYLHGTILISNLFTRIQDCLEEVDLKLGREEAIPAVRFIEWLESNCPETRMSRRERTLGLGVSNALRVLVKKGTLELGAQADADRFKLYPIEGVTLNDFSHVTIKR